MNELIRDALVDIVSDVVYKIYRGPSREYITFNYDVNPDAFGDDDPDALVYAVQVHYCCPTESNSLATRKAIRRALASLGGTYPTEADLTDDDGQEYVYSLQLTDADL